MRKTGRRCNGRWLESNAGEAAAAALRVPSFTLSLKPNKCAQAVNGARGSDRGSFSENRQPRDSELIMS
jgi:hypothetical protein